jgi:hypothetical protein
MLYKCLQNQKCLSLVNIKRSTDALLFCSKTLLKEKEERIRRSKKKSGGPLPDGMEALISNSF